MYGYYNPKQPSNKNFVPPQTKSYKSKVHGSPEMAVMIGEWPLQ